MKDPRTVLVRSTDADLHTHRFMCTGDDAKSKRTQLNATDKQRNPHEERILRTPWSPLRSSKHPPREGGGTEPGNLLYVKRN